MNEFKYLSLGPNIYGKIKTLFQTYTYFTTDFGGRVEESKEIITQVSTSLFSTTRLPASISIAGAPVVQPPKSVQLDKDELISIKESFLASGNKPTSTAQGSSSAASPGSLGSSSTAASSASVTPVPSLVSSQTEGEEDSPVINTKPSGVSAGFDKDHLNSLKSSYQSNLPDEQRVPTTDLNLPAGGPQGIRPPPELVTTGQSISPSQPLQTGAHNGQSSHPDGSHNNNGQSGSGASTATTADPVSGSQGTGGSDINPTPTQPNGATASSSAEGTGVIDAVVGGIAGGLGGVFGSVQSCLHSHQDYADTLQ